MSVGLTSRRVASRRLGSRRPVLSWLLVCGLVLGSASGGFAAPEGQAEPASSPSLAGPYGEYLFRLPASAFDIGPVRLGGSLDEPLSAIHGRATPEAFGTDLRSSPGGGPGEGALSRGREGRRDRPIEIAYGLLDLANSRPGAPAEDLLHLATGLRLLALDQGHDEHVVASLLDRLADSYAAAASDPVESVSPRPLIADLLARARRRGARRTVRELAIRDPAGRGWRFRDGSPFEVVTSTRSRRAWQRALAERGASRADGTVVLWDLAEAPPAPGAERGMLRLLAGRVAGSALDRAAKPTLWLAVPWTSEPWTSEPRTSEPQTSEPRTSMPGSSACAAAESAASLRVGPPADCLEVDGQSWLLAEDAGRRLRVPHRWLRSPAALDDLATEQGRALASAHRRAGMPALEPATTAALSHRLRRAAHSAADGVERAWSARTGIERFVPGSLR